MYSVTKKYGHNLGLSCCFRQHRAKSHCAKLHGYAIAVTITFMAHELDENNWVIDFGALKPIKEWLGEMFDHTTLIAADDPEFDTFLKLNEDGLIDMRVLQDGVGCEQFAKLVFEHVFDWLSDHAEYRDRVYLTNVTINEHEANAASYGEA